MKTGLVDINKKKERIKRKHTLTGSSMDCNILAASSLISNLKCSSPSLSSSSFLCPFSVCRVMKGMGLIGMIKRRKKEK